MEKLGADVFKGLLNLEDLDLSSNFFTEIPADALKDLTVLKTLLMQDNRIQVTLKKNIQVNFFVS